MLIRSDCNIVASVQIDYLRVAASVTEDVMYFNSYISFFPCQGYDSSFCHVSSPVLEKHFYAPMNSMCFQKNKKKKSPRGQQRVKSRGSCLMPLCDSLRLHCDFCLLVHRKLQGQKSARQTEKQLCFMMILCPPTTVKVIICLQQMQTRTSLVWGLNLSQWIWVFLLRFYRILLFC